jgi:hypothetical protein
MPRKTNRGAEMARHVTVAFAIVCTISPLAAGDRPRAGSLKLNAAAFDHARELINQGHFVADGKGSWTRHQPSAEQENEFIRQHNFSEYGKWHLGIDQRHAENVKARYKFPYGDFNAIHRCALLAVKSRAREYGHSDIESAAAELIEMISSKNPTQ